MLGILSHLEWLKEYMGICMYDVSNYFVILYKGLEYLDSWCPQVVLEPILHEFQGTTVFYT